jgi:hypothetical protein
MTVTYLYGRKAGRCSRCKRETGNLARHEPACRKAHEDFFADEAWMQTERAAAHSGQGGFRNGVTDLDVARVLLSMERGRAIVQGGSRWLAEQGSPLTGLRGNLVKVVDEMIRTGLARGVSDRTGAYSFKVVLTAAPVHLRGSQCGSEALRLRLVDHRDLADCPDCLA